MKTNFKIIAMLLCVVASMSFTSCSQDDEDMQKLIVGDWKVESVMHRYDYSYQQTEWEPYDDFSNYTWRFKEDGTFYENGYNRGEWILMNGELHINSLIFNFFTIEEMTKRKMIVFWDNYNGSMYKIEFKKS